MSQLKFVILRGAAGWGDRLQCLLQAIGYAKKTKRYLVVDWRDNEWSHDQKISADYYFKFMGVKTFELQSFLHYYAAIKDGASVVKKIWKPYIEDGTIDLYKKAFYLDEEQKIIQRICDYEIEDFDEDIVVYSGVGFRGFAYSDFQHIHPAPWVIDRIRLSGLSDFLGSSDYNVVHLRGGSKTWAGGDGSGAKEYVDKVNQQFPTLEKYLDHLWQAYQEILNKTAPKEANLFLLSDSPWLAEQWFERFQVGTYISIAYSGPMISSGIHRASEDVLQKHGVSKIDLNFEMLRDFAIMCNAKNIVHDGISLFSKMAERVKGYALPPWKIQR